MEVIEPCEWLSLLFEWLKCEMNVDAVLRNNAIFFEFEDGDVGVIHGGQRKGIERRFNTADDADPDRVLEMNFSICWQGFAIAPQAGAWVMCANLPGVAPDAAVARIASFISWSQKIKNNLGGE
ncbi:hypothetical protein PTE30175_01219 [Pandoraea terrae]|uniref:Uncharacterized protein n=1 Tax=Pandoraea terrae TaxID=1537710 RepID=A0A5E4TBH6_9BURK|nr:hypothetical protein [Pandoraea terrae]VVD84303.1 hypothetical protein PTE30175_01219 [Pandoraea terrae]